ncbi:putative Polynucleotidyl transferase [Quillaja saponaria]|uniref:Polynucleotidyl transferase n=1 Tax=Quillaja saponaria TaxID=32244 RepID=A0AAD7PBF1_QUISA|nr:putative Polynucleotidyl transferase [Quillaja saponaria]
MHILLNIDEWLTMTRFEDWLHFNLSRKEPVGVEGVAWCLIFVCGLWWLWTWRCKGIFDENFILPSNLATLVWATTSSVSEAFDSYLKTSSIKEVRWTGQSRLAVTGRVVVAFLGTRIVPGFMAFIPIWAPALSQWLN